MPWPRRRSLDASELETAALTRSQRVDKVIHRRTGADPDNRVGLYVIDRGLSRGALFFFGCHGFTGCFAQDQL